MVTCAKCGETLLGSVNRCWRCGEAFVSQAGTAEAPPVVHRPDPAAQPIAAQVVSLPKQAGEWPAWISPVNLVGALGGFIASGLALYACYYSHFGLAVAAAGMVLSAWGMYSKWRPLAMLGILLCAGAIGLACFNLAVDVYTSQHGVHPFSPNTPLE